MVESFSERCWLVSWGAIRCEHCCDDIQRGTTCEFARFSMLSHAALEEIPSIVVRMAVFRGSWNDSVGTT